MTRINTNVTSLLAQNILGRSNKSLEQALNRLSTGLRINTGKDDPAGLIASENLRSDITSIQRAIGNTILQGIAGFQRHRAIQETRRANGTVELRALLRSPF
jgi:flagellin-like hook-associated protein FlgL